MKYFTKEELEDITKGLLENPTRETLKKLNEKYNGSAETPILSKEIANVEENVPVMPAVAEEEPVVNQIPNFFVPTVEPPTIESNTTNNNEVQEITNFELPKLETPSINNQNNEQINFTGNLFENGPSVANLMQTTDNFNSVSKPMANTEVPVTGTPFFGPHIAPENNPIPVGGPVSNMPVNEPTMFGQIQQNYM